MRHPSGRVLRNTCDVYRFMAVQDEDGGEDPGKSYPTADPVGVRCSAQCTTSERDYEGQRAGTVNTWTITFALDLGLKVNDKLILYVGSAIQPVYVNGSRDGAGRGAAFFVTAREVL